MVSPSAGSIVLVRFPFSDLSASKLRPALVLASADNDDWILCQLTSNPYADARAVHLDDADFARGSLQRVSFARPGKLFTASAFLMTAEIGALTSDSFARALDAVVDLLRGQEQNTDHTD